MVGPGRGPRGPDGRRSARRGSLVGSRCAEVHRWHVHCGHVHRGHIRRGHIPGGQVLRRERDAGGVAQRRAAVHCAIVRIVLRRRQPRGNELVGLNHELVIDQDLAVQAGRVRPLNRDPHAGLFRVGQDSGGFEITAGQHGRIRTVDLGVADPVADECTAGQSSYPGPVDDVVQDGVLGSGGVLGFGVLGSGDVPGPVDVIGTRDTGAQQGRRQRPNGTERHRAPHASHGWREYAYRQLNCTPIAPNQAFKS